MLLSPFSFRVLTLTACLTLGCSVSSRAVEIDVDETVPSEVHGVSDIGTRVAAPEVLPASNEGLQAIERMKLPTGLKASLWAAEPMLANPVAFNFDEHGRIFVAETYRYRSSVLDIRDYRWMLEDDLACRTIEDRTKLIANKLGQEGVKELSIESELVRLVEDRDGDGKADHSSVYATGFNSPLDGIGSGVLARRGDVYFTSIPSLWKFTGHDKAETRVELSRGYGVRFNFTGHDLHGLTFGPDGKIYFSIGDRGAHVPTKEGGVVESVDTGAVFRCNPDGTQLEVFATGLRNPQSLLFTENGDLFTGDNDSDQGDQERLVHLVENGDSGWRIGYQFAPLGNAGVWNTEKMWHPRHAEQAAFLLAPVCNIEDGPSGIAYYPGTGLNASYRDSIFITHFKGSITRSGIFEYKLKPNGATYGVADAKPFLTSALPTDVKFGPDGRLYYSDWAEGWPKSKRGRIYAIFDPQHVNDPLVKETKALIAADTTKKTSDELVKLLGHADWRVRLEAQYTLAERGAASAPAFARVAQSRTAPPLARLHAIWGLGQLAAGSGAVALTPLHDLIRDSDPEVRAQSIKVLGDHGVSDVTPALIAALKDENNRVKFFAAQSLGKLKRPDAAPALLDALRANNDADNFLRHALVMGLVGAHNLDALAAAANDESRAVRLGVLLAYRRLALADAAQFLKDSDRLIVREAARAINDVPITAALPELAAMSAQPLDDEPVMLRVINARFRLGRPEDAVALAAYAARADAPEKLRIEAINQLALWPKPPARDRIVGVFRPLAQSTRDAATPRDALTSAMPQLLQIATPETVEIAALTAIEGFGAKGAADILAAVIRDEKQPGATRAAALNALNKTNDPRLSELVGLASKSETPQFRLTALPIAARLSPDTVAPLLARLVKDGDAEEQKAAYRTLANFAHPTADPLLAAQLKKLAAGEVPAGAQLELLDAAAKRSDPAIHQLLADRDAALAATGNPLAPYLVALEGGDAKRGQRIFLSQPVMACVRCHSIGSSGGGDAGPNLAMVGTRHDRNYLLESVVKPSAKIAPGFDSVVLTLKSGKFIGGIVANETPDIISLRNADGKITEVKKADITRREGAPSSMPEIYGAVLTKTELRDVVEFLAKLTKPMEETGVSEQPRALQKLD